MTIDIAVLSKISGTDAIDFLMTYQALHNIPLIIYMNKESSEEFIKLYNKSFNDIRNPELKKILDDEKKHMQQIFDNLGNL